MTTTPPDDDGRFAADVAQAFADALAANRGAGRRLADDLVRRMESEAVERGLVPDRDADKKAARAALLDLLTETENRP